MLEPTENDRGATLTYSLTVPQTEKPEIHEPTAGYLLTGFCSTLSTIWGSRSGQVT
jgi:hypothetical protein